MASIARERVTAEEFSRLPETNQPTELIDGEIIRLAAPKDLHQKIVGRLHLVLAPKIPGGELRLSPSDVYLDEYNAVQPDIFWVSGTESLCKLGEDGWWHGAPDLVIEIFSGGTSHRDRGAKFLLYEKHGTREYWMVDPAEQYVEVWRRAGKKFGRLGLFLSNESFESAVLGGATIDLAAVFAAEQTSTSSAGASS